MLCVVSSDACNKSGKLLAEILGVRFINLSQVWPDLSKYTVFNYGCSDVPRCKAIINSPEAVATCIDKVATFKALKAANIPHPGFTTRKASIPKAWREGAIVARKTTTGKGNEGMVVVEPNEPIPQAKLYTQYFYHSWEYRIVVFMGKVVGRFRKDATDDGRWEFTKMLKHGFDAVDMSCIDAAKALGIDYVGFDVIENEDGEYVILEANSGPVLLDVVGQSIKKHFK